MSVHMPRGAGLKKKESARRKHGKHKMRFPNAPYMSLGITILNIQITFGKGGQLYNRASADVVKGENQPLSLPSKEAI